MKYYERLKEAREDRDLTQSQVAIMLNIKQQQLYKYEKGIQEMSATKLCAFCKIYGVSADYILGLPKGLKWDR